MADTVVVACKLPRGLIIERPLEPLKDGEAHTGVPVGVDGESDDTFRINGSSMIRDESGAVSNSDKLVDGFGVTEGVPAELWAAWWKVHGDAKTGLKAARDGLIFAGKSRDEIAKRIRSDGDVKSKLDGVDRDKPGPGLEPASTGQ